MSIREDLFIPRGKTWAGPIWALLNDADASPVTLVNRTIQAQVRPRLGDGGLLYEWSTAQGNIQVLQASITLASGETIETTAISLLLTPQISQDWTWSKAVYDVELHNPLDPDDVIEIVSPSLIYVTPEVTHG